jgi:hypothetical protein
VSSCERNSVQSCVQGDVLLLLVVDPLATRSCAGQARIEWICGNEGGVSMSALKKAGRQRSVVGRERAQGQRKRGGGEKVKLVGELGGIAALRLSMKLRWRALT